MKNTTIAIDLAKTVFEIGVSDRKITIYRNCRRCNRQIADWIKAGRNKNSYL
jgi:hypothetical protein